MKLKKLHLKNKLVGKKIQLEDLKYLQKKVSGKSVYSHFRKKYSRVSKHKNRQFSFEH